MFPAIGLSIFSFGYLGGFARRESEGASPVLSVEQLLALAQAHGLAGLELPLARCFPGLPEHAIRAFYDRVTAAGLFLTVDAEVFDEGEWRQTIELAARLGESLIRVKLSKILGGSRYLLGNEPAVWFASMLERLQRVAPVARDYGIVIAIENHQDVTSGELLRLIEAVGDDVLGINLDTGSILATCEDPVTVAQAVAHVVRNVHLKDYRLCRGPEGFRLVRCALGEGVVDFPGIFRALAKAGRGLRASIELGAVVAREVHWLNPLYWKAYPASDVGQLTPFLQLLDARLESQDTCWQTPWEQAAPHSVLEQTELHELFRSVEFLKTLGAPLRTGLVRSLTSTAELSSSPVAAPL